VPELPEDETLRRGLSAIFPGRRIMSVRVLDPKVVTGSPEITGWDVTGHRIGSVGRRGKVLILSLGGTGSLLIHPKMTGQLDVTVAGVTAVAGGHPTPSMLQPMPNPTTRAVFALGQATCLYYNDARRFGWIRLVGPRPCATDPFLRRLGPEPLGEAFTLAAIHQSLTRHARAPVKAVLLDQRVVAGIGNIYADECLHHARIHPARQAGAVTLAEARRLRAAVRAVLRSVIETGGTSFAAYVNDFRAHRGLFEQHAERGSRRLLGIEDLAQPDLPADPSGGHFGLPGLPRQSLYVTRPSAGHRRSSGQHPVHEPVHGGGRKTVSAGGAPGNRTLNPRVKSPLLCQLS
jgi:formamidopyrimidine-DNA glycosylase